MIGPWWRLPGAPLRASVAYALASGAAGAIALALAASSWTGAGGAYLPTVAAVFLAAAAIIAGRVGPHHPFSRFGPGNQITLFRLVLASVVAGLVGEPQTVRAAWLAVGATSAAAVLDGLDGWLARRSGLSSRFGARFDMETDALLILLLSVLVWQHGKAGAWVLACGLMRYGFVAAGRLLPWLAGPLRSTRRGKTVAIVQFVGLATALAPPVPPPVSVIVAAGTLAALTWSFALDVAWLHRRR